MERLGTWSGLGRPFLSEVFREDSKYIGGERWKDFRVFGIREIGNLICKVSGFRGIRVVGPSSAGYQSIYRVSGNFDTLEI